jgi:hypothetical protein
MPGTSPYKHFVTILYILLFSILGFRSLYISLQITEKYGGTDLRCRVVGTRLLETNYSSYFYHWKTSDPVRYADPNDVQGRICNGNVVTPATMLVFYPITLLNYVTIRQLWTICQFLFILFSCLLLIKPDSKYKPAALVFALLFINTEIFFYNIERGQVYTFYTFIFAVFYRGYTASGKLSKQFNFLALPLFILIRPIAATFSVLLLLNRPASWLKAFLTGIAICTILLVLPFKPLWTDYLKAMQLYQAGAGASISPNTSGKTIVYPLTIEGANNLTAYKNYSLYSLPNLKTLLQLLQISLPSVWIIFIQGLCVLAALLAYQRFGNKSEDRQFLFCFFLYMLSELFLFSGRGEYNIIQWLVFGVILSANKGQHKLLYYLATLPLLLAVLFPHYKQVYRITELAFMVSILGYCFDLPLRGQRSARIPDL